MKKSVLFFLIIIVMVNSSIWSAQKYSAFEAVRLIDKEYRENRLTLDQKCLYWIYALRQSPDLPARFRISKPEELECGTPLILAVKSNWNQLSVETRDQINLLMQRPDKAFTYRTTHFVTHYDTASSASYPVYQPGVDINPADGVPDYVNRVAEYMERSWYVEIDSMGYYAPPFDGTEGGDSLYDIYIDTPYGSTWYGNPSFQYPDRPYACDSWILIGNDMRITRYPNDPLPFCKATCCHELFHACEFVFIGQIGYYYEDYTSWLHESCSNWIEESVFDELNDVYYYLNSYLPVSYQSLYHEGSRHMYASWIWNIYLSENYGKDIIYSIWLKYMDTFACAAIDSVLRTHGTTMNDQFQEFAVWNYFTDGKDDSNHYSEGANFFIQDTVVYIATHSTYPASRTISTGAPESYAANYVLFKTSLADSGTYKLTFTGDVQYVYGVDLILHKTTGSSYLKMTLNGNQAGELLIPDFKSYDKVIMVVTHLFNYAERYELAGYSYNTSKYITYLRGDANGDKLIDIGDVVYLVNYLFKSGSAPNPLWTGDVTCEGIVDVGDVVFLINYLFKSGPPPAC